MAVKMAIVLSGCGVNDGSEIHESVMALLAVLRVGAEPVFYAPDVAQTQVINHATKEKSSEARNALAEAARIARGKIQPLSELSANKADAIVFPGGFGAALNLCDFGIKGADCRVEKETERVVREFHAAKKPIVAICIAPALIAKVLGQYGVELTIGNDQATAQTLEKLGAKHFNCNVDQIHVDENNRVVTTPAYMLAENALDLEEGILSAVHAAFDMINE